MRSRRVRRSLEVIALEDPQRRGVPAGTRLGEHHVGEVGRDERRVGLGATLAAEEGDEGLRVDGDAGVRRTGLREQGQLRLGRGGDGHGSHDAHDAHDDDPSRSERRLEGARCFDDELLTSLVEGTSDRVALELVETHIDGCAPCRRLLSQLLASTQRLARGRW